MQRIAKASWKDDAVTMKIVDDSKSRKEKRETVFQCTEAPLPEFLSALRALEEVARTVLELPLDWKKDQMKITGVSWSYSEDTDVWGAVVTGQVLLDGSNAPFCFNTPHLPYEQYSETGESPLMPDECIALLDAFYGECGRYLDGDRAQRDLFGSASKLNARTYEVVSATVEDHL